MYKILAFENGQPIILYQSQKNVYMYTAASGRLYSKGLLFNDVKQDFEVYEGKNKYLYYISTDNKIKLASISGNQFVDFLSIPMEDQSHNSTIVNVSPVMCENELYIFYCSHNHDRDCYDIYYLLCSAPNQTCLIKRNVSKNDDFNVFSSDKKTYIILKDNCYYLSKNGKITTIIDAKADVTPLKNNIQQLKEELSDKTNQVIQLQKLLYEKNTALANANAAKKTIEKRYNELIESAGKLQEELRNIKFR